MKLTLQSIYNRARWDNNKKLWFVEFTLDRYLSSTGHHISQFGPYLPANYQLPIAAMATMPRPTPGADPSLFYHQAPHAPAAVVNHQQPTPFWHHPPPSTVVVPQTPRMAAPLPTAVNHFPPTQANWQLSSFSNVPPPATPPTPTIRSGFPSSMSATPPSSVPFTSPSAPVVPTSPAVPDSLRGKKPYYLL